MYVNDTSNGFILIWNTKFYHYEYVIELNASYALPRSRSALITLVVKKTSYYCCTFSSHSSTAIFVNIILPQTSRQETMWVSQSKLLIFIGSLILLSNQTDTRISSFVFLDVANEREMQTKRHNGILSWDPKH